MAHPTGGTPNGNRPGTANSGLAPQPQPPRPAYRPQGGRRIRLLAERWTCPILLLEEVAKPNVRGYRYDMTSPELHELETLGVSERVQLVQDLWDSIARSNAELPVPQWQQDELSRRKQRFLQHPEEARSWDEVRRDILQGK